MQTRKELKDAYKQMKFRMGVFQIRNTVNNKIFIESSVNLDAIFNRHKLQLDFGSHPNTELQRDWKTLGEDKFMFEVLDEIKEVEGEQVDYRKQLKILEGMYMEELQPFEEKGYHIRPKK